MTVRWIEPSEEDFNTPVERSLSDAEAIDLSRRAFKQSKPNEPDPRNDAQCLDEFLAVHWAEHVT